MPQLSDLIEDDVVLATGLCGGVEAMDDGNPHVSDIRALRAAPAGENVRCRRDNVAKDAEAPTSDETPTRDSAIASSLALRAWCRRRSRKPRPPRLWSHQGRRRCAEPRSPASVYRVQPRPRAHRSP